MREGERRHRGCDDYVLGTWFQGYHIRNGCAHRKRNGRVTRPLQKLSQHRGCELVGFVVHRKADYSSPKRGLRWLQFRRIRRLLLRLLAEFRNHFGDIQEEKLLASLVEGALVPVHLRESQGWDHD